MECSPGRTGTGRARVRVRAGALFSPVAVARGWSTAAHHPVRAKAALSPASVRNGQPPSCLEVSPPEMFQFASGFRDALEGEAGFTRTRSPGEEILLCGSTASQ